MTVHKGKIVPGGANGRPAICCFKADDGTCYEITNLYSANMDYGGRDPWRISLEIIPMYEPPSDPPAKPEQDYDFEAEAVEDEGGELPAPPPELTSGPGWPE